MIKRHQFFFHGDGDPLGKNKKNKGKSWMEKGARFEKGGPGGKIGRWKDGWKKWMVKGKEKVSKYFSTGTGAFQGRKKNVQTYIPTNFPRFPWQKFPLNSSITYSIIIFSKFPNKLLKPLKKISYIFSPFQTECCLECIQSRDILISFNPFLRTPAGHFSKEPQPPTLPSPSTQKRIHADFRISLLRFSE